MPLDDLALLADFFNGRLDFHSDTTFLCFAEASLYRGIPVSALGTPSDSSLGRIIDRDLYRDLVARQDPDIIHPQLARNMRGHDHIVRQLYLEGCVWKCFYDDTFKFNNIILRQTFPSLIAWYCCGEKHRLREPVKRHRLIIINQSSRSCQGAFSHFRTEFRILRKFQRFAHRPEIRSVSSCRFRRGRPAA